jgi:hypothetical protein
MVSVALVFKLQRGCLTTGPVAFVELEKPNRVERSV